jgi:ferritin-like metal-binding protein YciE
MIRDHSLHTLLVDEIRDLYDTEHQMLRALPRLVETATSPALRDLIETHAGETAGQIKRLERVFVLLDERPGGRYCSGIAGILEEGSQLMSQGFTGAVLDAGLIAAAQRAKHYEVGAYGAVTAWAEQLGEGDVAALLRETLEEERATDRKLSALAIASVNIDAAAARLDGHDRQTLRRFPTSGTGTSYVRPNSPFHK